ncbi:NADH-ubiquinone oxidoreductase-F iron-sulfur binding region domain-containing protein [Euzebya rosea]|uniref:NADH-ubiquinone oxidoreductase-F iron-sulfur binding region domain-containing protein n=1 Tax=Euzebya rosea TaxID=2052804 RepID=UPI000D3EA403|nr:NADH-ubiquinone oxidoreductase-F iron-sulfur binding region domain-containing protein [Euzebya rosea]
MQTERFEGPLVPCATDDLAAYLAAGGGRGVAAATARHPTEVIGMLSDAGLRGRGGAWFPTARKWASVADSLCQTRYVVCNAAEGEPGTFKDRWLLRTAPYAVIEGLVIAAHAVTADVAYIALKERFVTERDRVEAAIAEMSAAGLLDGAAVRVAVGPDEYLFGEEKAMLEVIEGRPALPRILPPYQVGLFAKPGSPNPTVVNNAETLANVTRILADGVEAFRSLGTPDSPGSMLFTVCGDVNRPGVYELPLGTPLRTLIDRCAGGTRSGRRVKAVFPGASSGVLTADRLDVPLSFEAMSAAGSGLGSGGFVVYDTSTCMVEAAAVFTAFLRDGSCGQCPACGQGTIRIAETVERLEAGTGQADVIGALADRSRSVTGGSRCGLPKGVSALVDSLIDCFEEEFLGHAAGPCEAHRALAVPVIADMDRVTGRVRYATAGLEPAR